MPDEPVKTVYCGRCAEQVQPGALRCKHCGQPFQVEPPVRPQVRVGTELDEEALDEGTFGQAMRFRMEPPEE